MSTEYPLYMISDDGHDAAIGTMAMQLIGFTNIKSLDGGLQAWEAWEASQAAAGTPATTAAPSPSP